MSGDTTDTAQDGGGTRDLAYGSEGDRGGAPPVVKDEPAVEHATRTIVGTDGPIGIVEDSGTAAADEAVKGEGV